MGAGYGDRILEPHQLGQHFRPADDRNAPLVGGFDLWVPALDRGRDDDHCGIAQIFGLVADHHLDALLAQPLDDIAFGDIGALHLIAEDVHHLGDAGHANAADADEVDRADIRADAPHA